MPDRETENQFSALPLWPEQYQYFRLTIYAPVFIFSFRTPKQSTPVPTLGLMDSNRYMCSSTALCLASVRRVLKLLTSYVRWLKSYSSRQLAGNLECSWSSTFQSRPSFPLILSLTMQTQCSPFLHTMWTAHTDNQTHCWNLGNLHSMWLSSSAPFLLIYE